MVKDLYGILIEDRRVLLVNRVVSGNDFWSIPQVKSNNPADLLSLLSFEIPDFSFDNAKYYPFVSFPAINASSFLITGYSRRENVKNQYSRLWIHGLLTGMRYDDLSSRILSDLEREDLIIGNNHYYIADF